MENFAWPGATPTIIAWCAFALFCGGLIKGTLGVGTPLLTVPMMTLVLPVQHAVALMAMPVVVANLWQASQAPNIRSILSRFWPAAVALLFGTFAGSHILSIINEQLLLLIVGSLVIVFTALQFSSYKLTLGNHLIVPAGILFGLLSGLIGGISSMFGPMLIVYLVSLQGLNKDDFVSAISFLYVCAVVPWTLSLLALGLLKGPLLIGSLFGIIPVSVGMAAGQQLRKHISEKYFQRLLLLILVISGASMIWQSLNGE